MNAIELQKLTKYYGKSRGIVELDLPVEQGEFFGFIGPNGAGKSTTIRALLGLIRADSGTASVMGFNAARERYDILRNVGYLPSEISFYNGMRAKDVIRLSASLRGGHFDEEATTLCQRLDLDVNKRVEELSLGNRKKVAIVCALQHRPPLYILDEPTSGLDPLIQREVFALLKERNADGATVFLSSHVLSEVQKHCRRAGIIREGRLVACDTVEALSDAAAKRVTVKGEADVASLRGVRDLTVKEDGVTFLYSGEWRDLLAVLAKGDVRDLTACEPDLDEIFLHYYANGGETV